MRKSRPQASSELAAILQQANKRNVLRYEKTCAERYYQAWPTRDLFGPCVVVAWGRIGAAHGQLRSIPGADEAHILELLEAIHLRRGQRGYELVEAH